MRELRSNRGIYEDSSDNSNRGSNICSASSKHIVAVDFDGTLVFNKYPFIENPNNWLLDFIREHRKEYVWVLWTCRHDEQLEFALNWLREEQNIVFDYVNANVPWKIEQYGDSRKIYADYYIDDKNVASITSRGFECWIKVTDIENC